MRRISSASTAASRNFAGTPSAIAPEGTTMPFGTTAPAPTQAPDSITARVQNDGTRADERAVVHRAALEVYEVADDAVVADDRGHDRGRVHDAAVLDRRARPDLDVPVVTAQHGLRPHRRFRSDRHVADHGGVRVHVRGGIDARRGVPERIDGHEPRTYTEGPAARHCLADRRQLTLQTDRRAADTQDHGRGGDHLQHQPEAGRQATASRTPTEGTLAVGGRARGAGLSRRELVAYERGKVPIPESDLWVLAGSCGVDVGELVPRTRCTRARGGAATASATRSRSSAETRTLAMAGQCSPSRPPTRPRPSTPARNPQRRRPPSRSCPSRSCPRRSRPSRSSTRRSQAWASRRRPHRWTCSRSSRACRSRSRSRASPTTTPTCSRHPRS